MPPSQQGFDIAGAHPMRLRARLPVRSRIGAITLTAAAHLVVIVALIEGLEQARIIHPPEILVQFTPEPRKPVETAAAPVVPSTIDAAAPDLAAPQIAVAVPAAPMPPMFLPSPPNADYGTSNAEPSWETALLNRVAQSKHAPVSAQHGVVLLHFTMDRDGKVLTAKIEKSSGFDALDQEALAALQRAQPLPIPPVELPGATLDLIVPVDFL
jgi:periplasmic protein TonB